MGRWLVGEGVKKGGGNEVISNGSYLREGGMRDGAWSLEFGCVFASLLF